MTKIRLPLFAFLLALLAGCGGGGGDDSTDTTNAAEPANVWDQMVWDEGSWQ